MSELPEGFDTLTGWTEEVLRRFLRMVAKQDYWRGYFDEEDTDAQVEAALEHALEKVTRT